MVETFTKDSALSREARLLLLLSRTRITREELSGAPPEDEAPLDWERWVNLTLYHRVFPLVHWNLKRLEIEGIPSWVEEAFGKYFDRNRFRIMALTGELVALAEAFETRGIRAVWLKGPALASTVYGNVALRPAGDLDVLVEPGDVRAALDFLVGRGYRIRLGEGSGEASPAQVAAIGRFQYHFVLVDETRGFEVELHFSLSPVRIEFGAPANEVIAGASTHVLGGRKVLVLNPVDNLIYLCVHGGKHAWMRIEWLVGVAELLSTLDEIDEEKVLRMARKRGAEVAVFLGVSLAVRLLGAKGFPALNEEAVRRPAVNRLSATVLGTIDRSVEPEVEESLQARFQWEMCDTVGKKARLFFLRKIVPNRADIAAAQWNPPLQFLYYLGPIRRLVSEAVRRCFGVSVFR